MAYSTFLTTNYHTGDLRKRQVSELLKIMSPREVPFLKLVGIDGESVFNTKYEWVEDVLASETSTVEDNPLLTATQGATSTITVPTGKGEDFQQYMVLLISDATNGDELVWISSVITDNGASGDTFTAVRGCGGTTPAAHAKGCTIEIIGIAHPEGTTFTTRGDRDPTMPYNYIQQFATSYKMSTLQQEQETFGIPGGDEAYLFEKAMTETMIKLERAALLGRRQAVGVINSQTVTVPYFMGGLDYFLSSAYGTNHVTTAAGGEQLTEKMIADTLQAEFYSVGGENMARTAIVGPWQKRRVSDLFSSMAQQPRQSKVGGVVIDTVETDFGDVDVLMSMRCPKDKIYFVNLDYVSIHPFKNNAFFDRDLPTDGDYMWRAIFGIYTMVVRNTKSMGIISGLATS